METIYGFYVGQNHCRHKTSKRALERVIIIYFIIMTVIEVRKCESCEKETARVFIELPNHDGRFGIAYCVQCALKIALEIVTDCDKLNQSPH